MTPTNEGHKFQEKKEKTSRRKIAKEAKRLFYSKLVRMYIFYHENKQDPLKYKLRYEEYFGENTNLENVQLIPIKTNINAIHQYMYNNLTIRQDYIYVIRSRDILYIQSIYCPPKYHLKINVNDIDKVTWLLLSFYIHRGDQFDVARKYKIFNTGVRYKILLFDLTGRFPNLRSFVTTNNIENEDEIWRYIYRINFVTEYKRYYIVCGKDWVKIKHVANHKDCCINLEIDKLNTAISNIINCEEDWDLDDMREYMHLPCESEEETENCE